MSPPRSAAIDRLFDAILTLKTREDCYRLFEDLCTIKEVQDMAGRFEAAELLDKGISYQKIAEQTGTSTATIGRVNRCLTYGSGGYRAVLDALNEGGDTPQ